MKPMPYHRLTSILVANGCRKVHSVGSHEKWETANGKCQTEVSRHREIAPDTLRKIRDHLAPCLGMDWLR